MTDPEIVVMFVSQVEAVTKKIAWRYGLASVLAAVFLAWLLARADVVMIHRLLLEYRCECGRHVMAESSGNTVTINSGRGLLEQEVERVRQEKEKLNGLRITGR